VLKSLIKLQLGTTLVVVCTMQYAIRCLFLLAIVLTFSVTGCTTAGPPTRKSSIPVQLLPLGLGEKAKEESLRKKVEADSFPRAAEVGL